PSQAIAPTPRRGKLLHERRLKVASRRLIDQADGAACEGDIVARLDAVQVLEEEAAARVHRLTPVLRLQQPLSAAAGDPAERHLVAASMARPELLGAKPAMMQANILISGRPWVAQRLATNALEDPVKLRRQVIQCLAQGGFPGGVALCADAAAAPALHAMRTAPRAGHAQRDLARRLMV